ncbi:thiamine pyrophosphate-dependent dehydrogenase E1 component subunit alpha [Lutispora saccharofermentans]|uniref:Thiamine pyrophosphate-dependent dehydrogenase E1 component subunit alpha n=1 Tax=Lutispora saccharofermentans TaxID=3024236 RepID=A0ABT1NDJ2_9FIRM|nr:thiamine pyrophosphate-dependent dehydrogenase E1 component subunit alpha [Lutispora saccharofermentans]MCQ1529322.1 thiamine pyrophosphate-dependent dehydrogenase E1 component subunit alpha [Lutispora saccharofermentans]
MKYSKSELLKFYEQLVLGRKYEEKIIAFLAKGKLQGFFHLGIGQEAAQVGVINALGPDDYLVPTHRFHPGLANKLDLKKLTAELFGKSTGYNRGKAFTFHISSKKDKILPVNGMLGAGIPEAVGYAWALKQDKKDAAVVCVMGDGAASEGNVHEGMNIAALLNVPIVFYIENNGWAISNPIYEQTKIKDLSIRGMAYGMPGVTIDGNDVVKVKETVEEAIAKAKKGEPSVVEAKTYRFRGHFEGDPCFYRDNKEYEEALKGDCIKRMEKLLLEQGVTNMQLEEIAESVQKRIDEAFDYAENAPMPTPEETLDLDQVYATNLGGELL